ncbi:phage tail tape measure protein [Secundilactobacillus pentosiphilus]|uniref:Phage tail tape measure protein n=1 Tax=Secundilactobacillus pentosiphilus TaxID=1714682 RepID=A0A1Z5IUM0_9LACO|nr:phage tail tape measure protein [Secundilactobacillus pentosiphilus]GAX05464.1 phage tail tape measure protein [Secundilactobacillus pentosiphilus]
MAGSLQSEDIGIQIKANLEVFSKIDEKFDALKAKTREISELTGNMFSSSKFSSMSRSLNTINNRFDSSTNNVKQLRGELTSLQSAFERNKSQLDGLSNVQKQYTTNTRSATKAIESHQSAVKRFNSTRTDDATRSINKTTSATQKMGNASKRLSETGSKFIRTGQSMAVTSTVIGAAMIKGANDAVKLQNQYRVITNLATYGGEKQAEAQRNVNKMQAQGTNYSVKYGVAQTKLSAGYEELIRRGYSTNQALATQKTFLQGALASGDDYTDVVHNATSAIEGFGLKSNNATTMAQHTKLAVNQMAYAADLTATDFQGMGDALRYVAATGRSANQSLSMTTSAIGILSNNGLEDTVAGTGLKKIINAFGSPNMARGQQATVMDQLGLKSSDFKQANGKLKSLADLMDIINNKTKNMGAADRMSVFHKFFGTTGQEAALILAKNTNQLRSLNNQVSRSQNMKGGGYIAQLSSKNLMSAQAQINIFKQAVNGLGVSFATTVLPNITDFIKGLDKMLLALNGASPATKKFVSYAIIGTAAIAPLSLAIGGLAKAISFARTAWLLLSGSMSKGLPAVATKSVASQTGDLTAATSGGSVGSRVARYGSAVGGIKGQWANSSLLGKASTVALGAGIGLQAANAFKDGVDTKRGGSELWNAGGQAVGGAIGFALGGPAGAMAGTAIGDAVTKAIDVHKIGKGLSDIPQEFTDGSLVKAFKNGETGSSHKYGVGTDGWFAKGAGTAWNAMFPWANAGDKYSKPKAPAPKPKLVREGIQRNDKADSTAGLNKSDTRYINQASKLETQANIAWASSAGKTYSTVKGTYDKLYALARDHAEKQLKTDKQGYNYLVKQGLLSSNSAKSAYNTDKSLYGKRLADLKANMKNLVSAETSGGKNREKAISKVNRQILSLTDAGGKRQQALSRSLTNRTTKLTTASLGKMISASNSAYKKTTSNANKTYRTEVSSANARYKKEVSIAKSTKGLSESQRKTIIAKAKNQRDKTVANAEQQRNDTVKWAQKQRSAVVHEAEKEAGEAANAFKVAAGDIATSIPTLIDSNVKAGLFSVQHSVSNTQAVKNYTQPGKTLAGARAKQTGTGHKSKSASPFGSFAAGGTIAKAQMAMVGEKGTELAYNPRTGLFRMLGTNGPTIERLQPGEQILNAKDTRKAFSGGIGAGKVLPGYADGTTKKLPKQTVATGAIGGNDNLSKTARQTKSSMKQISKSVTDGYSTSTKKSKKSISKFESNSKQSWKQISRDTKKTTQQIQRNTTGDFDDMQKGAQKNMNQLHSGMNSAAKATTKDFNSIFSRLGPYAHSGMSGAIGSLNGGIKGINSALSQFGGSHSVISPIHYAEGSKGPIREDQFAVLNDAQSGPRQEAVVRNNKLMFPQGENVYTPLQKNDEVLNGAQVKEIMDAMPHYAKGTKVNKTALRKLISNNSAHPQKVFATEFTDRVNNKSAKSPLSGGLRSLGKHGAAGVGNAWSAAAWNALSDAMSSGGSSAGGPVTHSPGGGWSVSSGFGSRGAVSGGFSQHDGVDYSGARTVHSMNTGTVQRIGGPPAGWGGGNGIGESVVIGGGGLNYIYQELNGKYGSGAKILVGKGDQVKAGQAIAILGSSATHVHVGATKHPMFSIGGSSTAGWLDPRTIKSSAIKVKKAKAKQNSALDKYVKKQLAPQIKWVSKNLTESDVGAFGLSGSIAARARTLADAIKKAYPSATNKGIAAVLGNWEFESGLNPGAINPGGGASGLGQWLGPRKSSLISYAQKHNMSWKNAGAQVDFALHGDGANSAILKRILRGTGSVASLANAFSSQWERGGYNAQHVAGARKIEGALKGFKNGGEPPVNKWSKVNEGGNFELFKPKTAGTVVDHKKSQKIVAGGGHTAKIEPHYDVHVEVKGGDSDAHILKLIKKALQSHDQELVTLVRAEVGDDAAYEFLG